MHPDAKEDITGTARRDSAIVDQFADGVRRFRWMGSPLYAEFCLRILDDDDLLALAATAPSGQPYTHLLFAAVQFLILEDPGTPLAAYYGSVTPSPIRDHARAFATFRDFCGERTGEIIAIMKRRTVQFTLAGRAAFVLPAIAYVARLAGEPLSFIDIGCSAGLLTSFARYAYDYGDDRKIGDRTALTIDSFRFAGGPPAFLTHIPKIGRLVGIDLNPVDPADPKERRWIDALCPPDMAEERRQLRAALDLRASIALPVVRGDALVALPDFFTSMPDPICALAAHCLYQWPADARAALDAKFRKASDGRSLYFVTIDHPAALDPSRTAHSFNKEGETAPMEHEAMLTVYRDGDTTSLLLGRYDSFGRHGVWLAEDPGKNAVWKSVSVGGSSG
jgi:hypothetical protein